MAYIKQLETKLKEKEHALEKTNDERTVLKEQLREKENIP